MKAFRLLPILLLSTTLFTSCDWHATRTVIGYGDIETEEIGATGFTGVTVTGTCNVTITTGDSFSVRLHAQPQVLEVMTCRVHSGILQIGFDPDYNVKTTEEISATIVVPSLDFVSVTGAGDFSISGAPQPRLDIHITGAGNVEAFDMEVETCSVYITGSGNCEVNVIQGLRVTISGVGNVFYRGTPEIISDISGVGNVIASGG
jgi:hypothetical protein